jgi:glycosyltransferase involved in cell wall biosynthesis
MRLLFLEPFDSGSHRRFLRDLTDGLEESHGVESTVLAMPGRHWKWRMRGAVPWLAQEHDAELRRPYDLVFASSYLALAELVGIYPELAQVPRILYFHENQLAYPVREGLADPARDSHFGFTQMVSALAATRCVFNSAYNRDSFLSAGTALLDRMPDARPRGWTEQIASKSLVLGLPLRLPQFAQNSLDSSAERELGPTLLWNHRWEHDKNPDEFFAVLETLAAEGVAFRLIVCGEQFREVPESMRRARQTLADRILHFGFVEETELYHSLLARSHIVVSTAVHEFFGVSVIEAVAAGARPLVPDRLSYQELFPAEFRYHDLTLALRSLCETWYHGEVALRGDRSDLVDRHSESHVVPRYYDLFCRLINAGAD